VDGGCPRLRPRRGAQPHERRRPVGHPARRSRPRSRIRRRAEFDARPRHGPRQWKKPHRDQGPSVPHPLPQRCNPESRNPGDDAIPDLDRSPAHLPQPHFAAALRQAEFLGFPLDLALKPDRTRSELEARFLSLCRRHRLPKPEVNAPVDSFIADVLWPRQRLIVELDGYRAHAGRAAFEADRARDMQLKALGYNVVRLTWRHLTAEPAGTAATLRRLLRAPRK
jgi:very-short-patch-repair endonuclease